jgi:transposase
MQTATQKAYASDLTDAQWAILEPLLPPARLGDRKRTVVDLREVINSIFSQSHRLPMGHVAARLAAQKHGV